MKSPALWLVLALVALGGAVGLWLQPGPEATTPGAVQSSPAPLAPATKTVATTAPAKLDAPPAPSLPAEPAVLAPASSSASAPVVAPSVSSSAPVAASPTRTPPVVGIQDGKTINFSSGQPVIIDTEKENAALAKALQEMEEATKGITFPARAPAAEKP